MGCVFSKEDKELDQIEVVKNTKSTKEKKVYSFDLKKAGLKKEDYMFQNKIGETLTRNPGQINGQQFIIDTCKNCRILLKDYTPAVNMYLCEDCEVYIGPCSGSVYIRNSKNCRVVVATAQLRVYNCYNFDLLVFSTSDPSIEQCSELRFGCFDFAYAELKEQFKQARLNVWNSVWSEVYDFTPSLSSYEYLPIDKRAKDLMSVEEAEIGVVPRTLGKSKDSYSHVGLSLSCRKECSYFCPSHTC
eukprot:TRINITY_DN4147_c0_g1_i1.p1 TRINITY_DN4147_c0_g1~~TRINITY_DN4147_c0_g1_i1.p1  ORF type:complete len:245 (-),score=72.96 TRINITY_DN4147_c0_g1_i1:445-1179(-)